MKIILNTFSDIIVPVNTIIIIIVTITITIIIITTSSPHEAFRFI